MTIPIGVVVHGSAYDIFDNTECMYTLALFEQMALTACAAAPFIDHEGCTEITVYFDSGDAIDCHLHLIGQEGDYGVQDKLAKMMIKINDAGDSDSKEWFQKLKLVTH